LVHPFSRFVAVLVVVVAGTFLIARIGFGQEESKDPKVVFAKTLTPPSERSHKTYIVDGVRGSDSNPGTKGAPFKTIQKAVDLAIAGDTVLVKDGFYREEADPHQAGVLFRHSGAPDAWIRVEAYPGCRPKVTSPTWATFRIQDVAYIEVSGFDISTEMVQGQSDPNMQRNEGCGIYAYRAHHVIMRDNRVHDCGGGGIGTGYTDYITVEGNDAWHNAYFSIYNCSGISLWQNMDFDDKPGYHNIVRDNRSWENENKGPTPLTDHKLTDGNGIIIDGMLGKGAILIENNVCWNNGGRGIQILTSVNVLVRNNTCAWNERTPEEISGGPGSDLRAQSSHNDIFENNIVVGRPGQEFHDNWQSHDIAYRNNLFFNYTKVSDVVGPDNLIGIDPMFRHAVLGEELQDFGLLPKSAAIGRAPLGTAPAADLRQKPRPKDKPADLGAYEH
jgi:Right handed beta helix region/Protein of unknown function (DUF1565)